MPSNEVPEWLVERFLLGELPERKIKELEAELKVNEDFKEKIEQVRTSNKEILNKHPLEKIVPEIENQLAVEKAGKGYRFLAQKAGYKRWLIAAPAIITVLILVFLILPYYKSRTEHPSKILDSYVNRIKGDDGGTFEGPHLLIFRKIDGGAELLKGESKVKAKDLLQIAYINKNDSFGVILSIDGNRVVTLHYPEDISAAPVLKKQQRVLLKNSYELDNAPGFERFFFISSKQKLDVVTLMKKAEELAKKRHIARNGKMILPDGFNQYTVILNKGE